MIGNQPGRQVVTQTVRIGVGVGLPALLYENYTNKDNQADFDKRIVDIDQQKQRKLYFSEDLTLKRVAAYERVVGHPPPMTLLLLFIQPRKNWLLKIHMKERKKTPDYRIFPVATYLSLYMGIVKLRSHV